VNKAAFFDLDNTLVKGSSLFLLARGLVQHKVLTRREIIGFAIHNLKFVYSKTERLAIVDRLIPKGLQLLRNKNAQALDSLCQTVVDEFLPSKLFKSVSALVEEHQTQGVDTWLVTASPIEIARSVARKLSMTGALGTLCEVKDGKYSGELLSPVLHGALKAAAVRKLSGEENYDLTECFAYSDSISDLPLLAAVGTPVVINPNAHLLALAAKNNWKVHYPSKTAA
jgi:HAD superfamily hydrolase (TIGR01490 family)